MSDELWCELRSLNDAVRELKERVVRLESRQSPLPPAAPAAMRPPAPLPPPVRPPSAPAVQQAAPAPATETLETVIGRKWLNRIGIVSLVLGVAFFILYTFQYLGPVVKIAIGVAISAMLIGLGTWVERRPLFHRYGMGLVGGGWALLYFTAYAMHHIPTVRIVQSPVVDLLVLAVVAAGAVSHSLKYRSEAITALAVLLGFITTSISDVTYFTLASSVLLVAALAWLVVRLRWYGLFAYGVVASYVTYVMWISPQIRLSPAVAVHVGSAAASEFWLRAGFLSLYWIVYNAVLPLLGERDPKHQRTLLAATLVNALVFTYAGLSSMEPLYHEWRYLFLLAVGAAYAALSVVSRRRLPTVSDAHLLLGTTFMTLALPLKLTERWTSFFWTVEIAAFVWIGLRYARWPYRAFAAALGILTIFRLLMLDMSTDTLIALGPWSIPWRTLIGLIGATSFLASAACYYLPQLRSAQHEREAQAFHAYFFAASVIVWVLSALEMPQRWLVAAWAGQSVATVWLGFALRDRALRLLGALGSGWAAVTILGAMVVEWVSLSRAISQYWSASPALVVIAAMFLNGWRFRMGCADPDFAEERKLYHPHLIAGAMLLTGLLWLEVPRQWVSVSWGVEGLALVAAGFLLQEKTLRLTGLSVFGLLILKILCVDLADVETIYRILSFIGVGGVLLAASLAYTRFSAKQSR